MKDLLKSRTWWLGLLSCITAGVVKAMEFAPETTANILGVVLAVAGAATLVLRTQDKVNEK